MDDEKLIAEVRIRPVIWDKSDKRHNNREVVTMAWDTVAEEVGGDVTTADCKKRWTSIKDYFYRKHKEILMREAKHGHNAIKKRKWHLYDSVMFLLPSASSASTNSNLPDNFEDSDSYDVNEQSQFSGPASPLSIQSDLEEFPESVDRKRKAATAKSKDNSDVFKEILKTLKEQEMKHADLDEDEHFFKSLFPSLKSMDEVEKMQFRIDVQQLVLDYLLKARARKDGTPPPPLRQNQMSSSPHGTTAAASKSGPFKKSP